MLRVNATDGDTATGGFARGFTTFGLFGAAGGFAIGTVAFFGGSAGFFNVVFFTDFFRGFLEGFLATFFAAVLFTVFLAAFFALPAVFTTRLVLAARFFAAAFLLALARGDLRTFFALRFLDAFFFGVATTNSFMT